MARTRAERRIHGRRTVDNLVKERQALLVLYGELASLRPYAANLETRGRLQRFCQLLVDYAALGHFEVYEHITRGVERRQRLADLAASVYPLIEATTREVVDFDARYASEPPCENLDSLAEDLSRLGEQLALRIECEDQLIDRLLASPSAQAAP